jgi:8-oxo-dGTP pyrophosphatase MutT (NUDIX family)
MTTQNDNLGDMAKVWASRMTNTERDQTFPDSAPRDAATLMLIDRSAGEPKVLLGRRHDSHKFMPGKFVFPGGRIEASDERMTAATEMDPVMARKIAERPGHSLPDPRAFPLAAIRETFEETGLMLGVKKPVAPAVPAGEWDSFAKEKIYPDLANVHFIARAITPPRRPRRFDTRFFTADVQTVAHRIEGVTGPDAELVELVWIPIREAKRLDMPTITGIVLEELEARVKAGMDHGLPVPFYFMEEREYLRELL